jgi:L-seryl-tRNA(Ser) seleniumtransferase
VGTTNRTRLADYRAALSLETAMILKVHPSNFRIVGFTEEPPLEDLAALAREAGIPLVEDQGSGLLRPPHAAMAGEPTAGEALRAGADLVPWRRQAPGAPGGLPGRPPRPRRSHAAEPSTVRSASTR